MEKLPAQGIYDQFVPSGRKMNDSNMNINSYCIECHVDYSQNVKTE